MIACLCPVYGVPPHLLEESIRCFLDQTHNDKHLIILDDYGNLKGMKSSFSHVDFYTLPKRANNLMEKYIAMTSFCLGADAICIWDVDDLYLPNHLEEHHKVLQQAPVSYPREVWSTYTGRPQKELSGGRFWASSAIRMDLLAEVGYINTKQADFDQQNLHKWMKSGHAAGPPTYVFRWGDTEAYHCQALMKSPSDETWYDNHKPTYTQPIVEITPQYRPSTQRTLDLIWQIFQ